MKNTITVLGVEYKAVPNTNPDSQCEGCAFKKDCENENFASWLGALEERQIDKDCTETPHHYVRKEKE